LIKGTEVNGNLDAWVANCGAALAVALCAAPLPAFDNPPSIDVTAEQRAVSELAHREFGQLAFHRSREPAPEFDAQAKSILKWSNPDLGRIYGDVFLWTEQGRPVVVASIHCWVEPYNHLSIELCSLADGPVVGRRAEENIWNTAGAGLTWNQFTDAASPASSRTLRLAQMKRLAARFSARLLDKRTDGAGVTKLLRPLTTPLYRYPEDAAADGALFTFVVGTDPELMLLIESHDGGWRYGLGRMNGDEIEVSYNNELVSSIARLEWDALDSTDPYFIVTLPENVVEASATAEGENQAP
jgi:hypothetical protein